MELVNIVVLYPLKFSQFGQVYKYPLKFSQFGQSKDNIRTISVYTVSGTILFVYTENAPFVGIELLSNDSICSLTLLSFCYIWKCFLELCTTVSKY